MSSSLKRCCNNGTVTAAAAALPGSAPSGDPPPCGGRSSDAVLRPAILLTTTTMSRARWRLTCDTMLCSCLLRVRQSKPLSRSSSSERYGSWRFIRHPLITDWLSSLDKRDDDCASRRVHTDPLQQLCLFLGTPGLLDFTVHGVTALPTPHTAGST